MDVCFQQVDQLFVRAAVKRLQQKNSGRLRETGTTEMTEIRSVADCFLMLEIQCNFTFILSFASVDTDIVSL